MGGTILSSFMAGFLGSMVANQFFDSMGGADFSHSDPGVSEPIDSGYTDTADFGGGDFGGDI
jgi:hypothetical protein